MACTERQTDPGREGDPKALRIMSFNIRYATERDGDNAWSKRTGLVEDRIRAFSPDLVGIQEALAEQADHLRDAFPAYVWVGRGRIDGRREGEQSGLMIAKERFTVLEEGHFWLSESPEQVGSLGWDAQYARMVSWARLQDRNTERALSFFNTHLDHVGERARLESAKLIRARVPRSQAAIVTGDFNARPTAPPHEAITAQGELRDSFLEVHSPEEDRTGSLQGFGTFTTDARIDWILHTPSLRTRSSDIDTTTPGGRYPSDHFPVRSVLEYR